MRGVVGIAVALTLAFTPTSSAGASPTSPSLPPALKARVVTACARVPNLTNRVDNLIARLPAGPDTPGSIAAIKNRANTASARGRTQVAAALNKRADVLTQKLATLPNEKATLAQVQAKCQQLGPAS